MRKIALSLLAISFFVFILSACTLSEPTLPVTKFKALAVVNAGEQSYSISVESAQDGCIKIAVDKPKTLNSLQYTYIKDTLYIDYQKLRCNATSDYLSSEAFADVIYRALSFDSTTKLELKDSNTEQTKFNVKSDYGDIELLCDTKSGEILKITPSYADVTIEFEDKK